ncbi:MAG: rhodanese-like domain-containing protein [Puniceicoccales bacterium]
MTIILVLAVAGTAISAFVAERPAPPSEDPYARTAAEIVGQDVLWIDARKPEVFATDHIPGAVNVSLDAWDDGFFQLMDAWTPDSMLIVYCDGEGCALSREVAERLRKELGSEQVFWLDGGIDAWREVAP